MKFIISNLMSILLSAILSVIWVFLRVDYPELEAYFIALIIAMLSAALVWHFY